MNKPTKIKEWEKEFEKFLRDDFDRDFKKKTETHRWLFCWNGEQNEDPPFDCACCLDKEDSKDCGCICHTRINQFKQFISKALSQQKAEIIEIIEKEIIEIPKGKHQGKSWCPQCEDTGNNYACDEIIRKIKTLK